MTSLPIERETDGPTRVNESGDQRIINSTSKKSSLKFIQKERQRRRGH